jgi:hypothetical protein
MNYASTTRQTPVFQVLIIFAILFGFITLSACSGSDEKAEKPESEKVKPDYYALESERLDSTLQQSTYLKEYQAGKSVLRALGSENKPALLNTELYETAGKYAFRIMNDDYPTTEELLMDAPLLLQAKEIYDNFPPKLYDLNEEDYQPILFSATEVLKEEKPTFEWNASYEHLLLSIVTRYAQMPEAYSMYEINNVNPESISDNEVKALAYLYKAVSFSEHNLPYHAAENALLARKTVEETGQLSGTFTRSMVMEGDEDQTEESKSRLIQVCLLIEGLARMQMTDEDDRKAGIPLLKEYAKLSKEYTTIDEWTVLSELLTQMQENRYDDADVLLDQYNKTKNLTFSEKMALKSERKKSSSKDAAGLRNIIITGIVAEKLYRYVQQTGWFQEIQNHPIGEGMINAFDRIENLEGKLGDLAAIQSLF